MKFAHLHCHSYFSMMRGTMPLKQLVAAACEQSADSLALTDIGGLYAWVEFVQMCRQNGIRPLCGVDLVTAQASAVLLAKDPRGYERICRIVSDFHLEENFSLRKALLEDRGHLAILSRDLSLLETLLRETDGRDLYVEVIPLTENSPQLRFAHAERLKPVASNDVYFLKPRGQGLHRLLRAIDGNTKLSRLKESECVPPERFFCSADWIRDKLSYVPEAVENAARLSEELHGDWRLGDLVFPPFAEFSNSEAYFTLRWKCYQGAQRRYGRLNSQITARLEHELEVIRKKGFTHYFLVVDDIVRQAPRTCGRGSVAASIVSYCLEITHVDPIEHNLFFERFLNPERKDPPDADIDFPWDERDKIFEYIFSKYGTTRAACVANHVRLQPQSTVREVAKVWGLPDSEITAVGERLLRFPPKQIPEPWEEILKHARWIEDFPRHLSVHAGGVVIVPDDLRHYVPLQRAAKGVNILQWEKDQTEDFGLVKIDILGNRSLSVVRDALEAVHVNTGHKIEYAELDPTLDSATQEMLKRGDTMGVFYIESPATRLLQKKARVGDYKHIVIHSSIIRPASHRYINEYVERLHGKPYEAFHPLMEEILHETYGLMVYQEDVTKSAMALAGFSAMEGDGLRKALSKKRPEQWLPGYRRRFFEGALERGVALRVIELVWQMIESFAGYSFCKPHSASYALVSFQSAFLRAHYPAEFMAAVISNGGGFYSTFAYLSEARRMGLEILPPDINLSDFCYRGRERQLRTGLMQLKSVREDWLKLALRERESRTYASLEDFLSRVKSEVAEVQTLIRAGCFDSIAGDLNRPQLLWILLQVFSARGSGEVLRFDASNAWVPEVEDYSQEKKLHDEVESLGLMLSRHPLTLYRDALEKIPHLPADQMETGVGKRVTMVGWLITGKVVSTKHQESMEFMTFEDLTGIYETTFFPQAYRRFRPILNQRQAFCLGGRVEDDHGGISLNVDQVTPLNFDAPPRGKFKAEPKISLLPL